MTIIRSAEYHDHERDLRKHEPRPTDPMSALEIAMIVRGLSDIRKAAELIESFARCRESGARVEATAAAYDHVLGRISKEIDLADVFELDPQADTFDHARDLRKHEVA